MGLARSGKFGSWDVPLMPDPRGGCIAPWDGSMPVSDPSSQAVLGAKGESVLVRKKIWLDG